MAKRVSVINFKGGVGKTTLSFNFAAGLSRFHNARVLLIDMDHQSSLSIVCQGAVLWKQCVGNHQCVNEIFRPFVSPSKMPGKEIICDTKLYPENYPNIKIVPSSLALDDLEIELTASHHGNAIQSEWDKRTLICRWIEETKIDSEFDYIIFDCPPATKIVSQNAIAASHGYIIPVVPEAVMERGAPHLVNMMKSGIDKRLQALSSLGGFRSIFVPDTKLVGLVVTKIQTSGRAYSGYVNDHTQHLSSLKRTWQKSLLKPYIEAGTGISQSLSKGLPVYSEAHTQNIGGRGLDGMYKELTKTLKNKIDKL